MLSQSFVKAAIILFSLLSLTARGQQKLRLLYSDGTYSVNELAFEEDFNAPAPDRNKWLTSYPWGRHLIQESVMGESLEYYTDGANAGTENGILTLTSKKEKICGICQPWEDSSKILINGLPNYRCFEYSSGMLYSKEDFGFGYYEARFKQTPQSKGLWPAFWLYGGSNEIDIFENKGERPNETHWDVHCKDGCKGKKGGWTQLPADFTSSYNTIGLFWHPGGQRWYHGNNNYKATYQPFDNKMNIILNLAVARDNKNMGFWVGPDANTVFPSSFEVDYVRYYKLVESGKKLKNRKDASIISSVRQGSDEPFRKKREKPKRKKEIIARIIYNETNGHYSMEKSRDDISVNIYNEKGVFLRKADQDGSGLRQMTSGNEKNIIVLVKSGRKKYAFKL